MKENNIDSFPIWKPNYKNRLSFSSNKFRARYDAIRGSSGGFISKKDVRDVIMKKCNNRCVLCGSSDNLQVDHIVSVYLTAKGHYPIEKLNTYEILRILCGTCNSRKSPNAI